MTEQDLKIFSDFLKEFQSETDRGAVLVGAAFIDDRLERLLISHLLDSTISKELVSGNNAPLGTFSSRIKMNYALGLITELEFKECEIIRRIRNEFAHSIHGMSFKNQKIHSMCLNLKANTPDGARFSNDARQLFINSVISVLMSLWYRPEYSMHFRVKTNKLYWEMAIDVKK